MTKDQRLKAAAQMFDNKFDGYLDDRDSTSAMTKETFIECVDELFKGAEAEAESSKLAINKLIEQFEDKIKSAEHLKKPSGTWGDTTTSADIERLNVRIYERKTFVDALKSLLTP